jgi:hypothetical protein
MELKSFLRSSQRGLTEKPSEYGLDGSIAENGHPAKDSHVVEMSIYKKILVL